MSGAASKVDVEPHSYDLSEAVADRRTIELRVNVFPAHACVGIQVPIERQRNIAERSTLDVLTVQVDIGPPRRNFPCAAAHFDSVVGCHPKEILKGVNPVHDA